MKTFSSSRIGAALLAVVLFSIVTARAADAPKTKVGFLYVGPVSDFGWTHSHDLARQQLEKALPWVETSYVESVSDGDVESYIDQMADQGVKVIFPTSTTFVDGTIASAARHPDIIFLNASGYKRAPNVATYDADAYQCFYIMGLAAGGLTKSGKIGFVSTFPLPESVRAINSFSLGLRDANPKATVDMRWLNAWYDPPAAKEASEALLAQGADVLITDMDSPTVAQVAESHHVPVNGHAFNAYSAAPTSLITGDIYNFGPSYIKLLQKIHDGTLTNKNLQNVDEWWRLGEDAVEMFYTPGVLINPRYKETLSAVKTDDGTGHPISVYDLIAKRFAQMSMNPPQFEPFTGPLTDAAGKLRVPAGQTATRDQLFSITWRLPNVVGSWPNPP
jgi:simple sugar transport system substrate-binding protein